MRKIIVFNMVSLDGFIADASGDMRWARKQDSEWNAFVAENAQGECVFLFGRVTYEMMASFWPTPYAIEHIPLVATRMNAQQKYVFTRTLQKASWENTTLMHGDLIAETRRMKNESGPNILIFGSGTVISQLAQARLIDEYQVVVNPIVLGKGKAIFSAVEEKFHLKLTRTRVFGNGNVLLCYEAIG
jgi:dihydrofolate reductase